MHHIHINIKKVFNPDLACTRGSDTTVGTEGIKRVSAAEKQNFRSHQESMYSVQNREEELNKTYLMLLNRNLHE